MTEVDLSLTHNAGYDPGRPFAVRALWLLVEALLFANPVIVSYRFKVALLRLFGARVGRDVLIKPGVCVKYPWRLSVGDNSWIGERVWIDNMEDVVIGRNVVLSQGAYLCTGNHDWSDPGMPLAPRPVTVEDGAWIGAWARVAPGRIVGREAIVSLGAVLLEDAAARGIYVGNPARRCGERTLEERA